MGFENGQPTGALVCVCCLKKKIKSLSPLASQPLLGRVGFSSLGPPVQRGCTRLQ